jgi:beta-galactosidase
MVKEGVAKNLEGFVEKGGTLVSTFFSGIVNESDLVTLGGYPGELRALLGIWVEEVDALEPSMRNSVVMKLEAGALKGTYECGMICDVLHCETAEVLAEYGQDFYAGTPAVTVNAYGRGNAYYVATDPNSGFIDDINRCLLNEKGITAPFKVSREKRSRSFLGKIRYIPSA